MKYRIHLYLALIAALLCLPSTATAQMPAESALLYKITGPKLKKPSYLFGTIHLVCEKDLSFGEKLGTYLAQTDQIILEVDFDDPAELKKVAGSSIMPNGKSLKEFLTAEEFTRLDVLYKSHLGISFELLQHMKPMMANIALFMSPKVIGCVKPEMFDLAFAEVAKQRKMPLIGLESAEEQLALIDSLPMTDQIKSLKELGLNPDKSIGQFQNLYKVYLSQDSDSLNQIISTEMAAQGSSQDLFLVKRNQKWTPLIESHIVRKPTFIGVGSGHLGGKSGLVALLRAKGYKLTPIRL